MVEEDYKYTRKHLYKGLTKDEHFQIQFEKLMFAVITAIIGAIVLTFMQIIVVPSLNPATFIVINFLFLLFAFYVLLSFFDYYQHLIE